MRFSFGSYEYQPHVGPPPSFHCCPCQLLSEESLPTGAILPSVQVMVLAASNSKSLSGPVLHAVHTFFPLLRSYAIRRPRTPYSPPEIPVITLSLKTFGAFVFVSPILGLPFLTDHSTFPVAASSATRVVSACCRKILPSPYARPRLTVSQHMTGTTSASCFGSYFHLKVWSLRLTAYTLLGNGVCIYNVSPITRGAPS